MIRPASFFPLGHALLAGAAFFASAIAASADDVSPYQKWTHGPPTDPHFFPIAVWCQSPSNAAKYLQAGFNVYMGLWDGPTEDQLAALKKAGMKVICAQNEVGLRHLDDPTIIGWMHGDEPDNAQELPDKKGYGPPIPPDQIVSEYQKIVAADPSRPVLLNLSQGVAWDTWYGRGVRTNHPEDYPAYMKGGDIVSFDIYPVAHDNPQIAGKLWYVPLGVDHLRKWAQGQKVVWNCLECTHISTPSKKATPHQVRAEAWMSLIHGSQGLNYFVHEFTPKFNESALLDDPEMLAAVTTLNHQIASLAPVLNSPTFGGLASIESSDAQLPVDCMTKHYQGSIYIFAVAMRDGTTRATVKLAAATRSGNVTVIDENRSLTLQNGSFSDNFGPWDVHLYRIDE
jgi:hypothetical protein